MKTYELVSVGQCLAEARIASAFGINPETFLDRAAELMVHAYVNRGMFDNSYIDRASGIVRFGGAL